MSTETARDQLAQPPLAPFRVEQANAVIAAWLVVDAAGQVVRRTTSEGSAQAEADRMNAARGL